METRDVIAMGIFDHTSHLYSFADFVDTDNDIHDVPNPLSRVNNSCEENTRHLNHFVLEISVELPTPPPPASLDMSSTIQQDDLYASNIVVWDEFLDALLDKSHNEDLVNAAEGVSLRDTSSPSLEIGFPNSSCSLIFSHLIGQLNGVTESLSLETPIQSSKIHRRRPSFCFLTFYMKWLLHHLMYLSLPKWIHVSRRHWNIFFM